MFMDFGDFMSDAKKSSATATPREGVPKRKIVYADDQAVKRIVAKNLEKDKELLKKLADL